ncbi:type II secretion system minor pseudopilin GspI [Candidatus Fukatsuia symbiotica]|uniref:Type II secretion system protein I n=2 Tax=Candidatus Fukatsuia TaxID=1927833 RepID=A0A2U8I7L5_9GAMM|nr:type II secretion system minor pseudopilin GspI [Candidatus Fukatsuia symbiotica]AWK15162.1 type II secretion system protein GspI [Candidatus Fukatsuia symbiotica]MEA9443986.1 type II secretion system minor pseudopilin GspI [Candidatus Fukatsuia symbiotica]
MKKNQGMTLLEVMVALVIFSIAGLTIVTAISEELRGLNRLEERIYASWIAENILVEIKLNNYPPKYIWSSGNNELAGQQWYWRWRGGESTNKDLILVTIEIRKEITNLQPDFILIGYAVKR